MLNIEKLFDDCGVPHESMNRRGVVSLACPKCGSSDNLAWISKRGYFRCWSCGVLPLVSTLSQLTGLLAPAVVQLLKKYQVRQIESKEVTPQGGAQHLEYPDCTGALLSSHISYLKKRGLDPDQVQSEFGMIYGTPAHAAELPNRLIAPLYLKGDAVSWQARSIHPACDKKYRYHTCPPAQEVIWHKETLYGLDQVPGDMCAVVEGLFDCWKLGPGAVHCFGTSWLDAQMYELATRFKRVVVMFDAMGPDDPQGKAQASGRRLAEALAGLGVVAAIADIESSKDPGDMPIEEARALMREIISDN